MAVRSKVCENVTMEGGFYSSARSPLLHPLIGCGAESQETCDNKQNNFHVDRELQPSSVEPASFLSLVRLVESQVVSEAVPAGVKVLGGRGGREPVPNTALSSLESFYLKMGSYVTPFFLPFRYLSRATPLASVQKPLFWLALVN